MELFKESPSLVDIVNFLQYEQIIEIPTETDIKNITMTLLWEGEELEIYKKSAKFVTDPNDMLTRNEFIKIEILINSIRKIDEELFFDEDPIKNKALKESLRYYILKFSPSVIQFLYECYMELCKARDIVMKEKTEELKKKLMTSIANMIQGSLNMSKQSSEFPQDN